MCIPATLDSNPFLIDLNPRLNVEQCRAWLEAAYWTTECPQVRSLIDDLDSELVTLETIEPEMRPAVLGALDSVINAIALARG